MLFEPWLDLLSKLQLSHILGLSGRSGTENESDDV